MQGILIISDSLTHSCDDGDGSHLFPHLLETQSGAIVRVYGTVGAQVCRFKPERGVGAELLPFALIDHIGAVEFIRGFMGISTVVVMIGANDILQGHAAGEVLAEIKYFAKTMRAKGFRVVIVSPMPFEDTYPYEALRLLEAEFCTAMAFDYIDGKYLVDMNTTLFNGTGHLLQAGHAQVANNLQTALVSLGVLS